MIRMYGSEKIKTLLHHYGRELSDKTIASEQFTMPATISSDFSTEYKTFCRYLAKQLKDGLILQRWPYLAVERTCNKRYAANNEPRFEHFSKKSERLYIPVGTVSVEQSFSQMKLISLGRRKSNENCNQVTRKSSRRAARAHRRYMKRKPKENFCIIHDALMIRTHEVSMHLKLSIYLH